MGRPTDDPKNKRIKFRISEKDNDKLEYISKKLKLNKSEVLRQGIEIQYNSLKESNE